MAWIRALHFASCVLLAGMAAFAALVPRPAFAASRVEVQQAFARWPRRIAAAALATALVSGAAWFLGVAADISGRPVAAAFDPSLLGVVLARTHFGTVWMVRLAVLLLMLACGSRGGDWPRFGFSLALVGSLAWV